MNNTTTAYLLWCASFFSLCGLHRIYNGKIGTGLLWMFTFGLCGFGQLIDLVLIPSMVEEHNTKYRARLGMAPNGMPLNVAVPVAQKVVKPLTTNEIRVQLVKAAANRGGQITVTQAVMDTSLEFEKVEEVLKGMVKTGYVGIDNDPDTGAVVYRFTEL